MKQTFIFLMLFVVSSLNVKSEVVEIDGIFYNLSGNEAEVTTNPNDSRWRYQNNIIVIPPTVIYENTEYIVTSIGDNTFAKCGNLSSVTIPNSIINIGKKAFYDCYSLTSVTIGNGVTSIGSDAFKHCNDLKTINRIINIREWCEKDPITYENEYANPLYENNDEKDIHLFSEENTEITDLIIPDDVTAIRSSAFEGCSFLISVTIPNSVTSIPYGAFNRCWKMTKVMLNSNAIVSKDYTDNQDHNLPTMSIMNIFGSNVKEYILGENVTSVGKKAFFACNVTTMTIGNNVTTIEEKAFAGCSYMTSLTIGNSVKTIGVDAFSSCYGLPSVTIPNSVTIIGDGAFNGCFGMTSITISNSVTSIGDEAFSGCAGLNSIIIPNSVKTIGNYAFTGCNGLAEFIIPNSVSSIGEGAFKNCNGLTSFTIPENVEIIGEGVLAYCNNLNSIVVDKDNTKYDSRENCNAIIETANNTLIAGCQNTIIPNSVKAIGNRSFWGCSSLTSVTIPNSVTNIGERAFSLCTNLTSIVIGNSITSIEDYAIAGCSNLTNMYCYAEQVPQTGYMALLYSNCDKATLHIPEASIVAYSYAEQWMDFGSIVALTEDDPKPTGIKEANSGVMTAERYFSIDGKRVIANQRGLYIIKMSDGTTKKVAVK